MAKTKPTLHQAAEKTIAAIESESLPKIKRAGAALADALSRDKARYNVGSNQGRPRTVTDEQIRETLTMTLTEAGKAIGLSPSGVSARRAKIRAADEAAKTKSPPAK